MRPSKRKSVPVTVKVGSQPSVPKKMGHFRWLSYYWDDFTFTRKYRELYLFQKFSELWEMEKVLGFEVWILCLFGYYKFRGIRAKPGGPVRIRTNRYETE